MIKDDPSIIAPIIAHLKESFKLGKSLPIPYRKQQLRNLIRGIKELEPKFHEAIKKDLGLNTIQSTMLSTGFTLDEVEYCLKNVDKWIKPETTDVPLAVGPGKSYVLPEPLGVGLVVGPWNYPLANSVAYVASAIAAGNCCVVKPSELSPNVSNVIAELFEKYMDKDCYRCIEGQVEVAKAIVKQNFDIIIFTGSTEKGKLIAKAAAENLITCVLELGGKSPTIVDRNADLDNAAFRIMQGRFMNSGQTCVACDYVFVHKDVKEQLIQRFKQKLIDFYGEDPSQSADYSRIVNDFHLQRLKGYLDESHGGKVIVGGQVKAQERFIAPTIIDTPRHNSKLMQDEIFGPILPIYEYDDFDYVINFIKDRPKPLALYYYGSTSSENYKRLKTQTSSGSLAVNESVFQVAILQAPFGGVGFSGSGKLHGYNGFKAFSHFKSVLEKGGINFFPFNARYPPYAGTRLKVLNMMLKVSSLTEGTVNKALLVLVLLIVFAVLLKVVSFGAIAHGVCNLVTDTKNSAGPNKISQ